MRRTEFYCTRDYDNASGIAEALRDRCCLAWHLMHQHRKDAAPLVWALDERQFRLRLAQAWESELRTLLRIRRDGMN